MSANETTLPGSPPEPTATPDGIVSSGWLGPQSIFERTDDRKVGRAMATSVAVHLGGILALVWAFTVGPAQALIQSEPIIYNQVFLPEPGPGGGGGGSPAPAPPKAVEIAKHTPPPAVVVPVAVPLPDPPPTLIAPIETNSAVMQAAGKNPISLATYGGGGQGGGIGSGQGNGVGQGTGGGFGGGAYAPGNGVSYPKVILEVKPKYTPDAMRAKLQGSVELEIVVRADGTVGDVRIVKSLDRASGLDDSAIEAAKKWLFTPGMKDGKPVDTKVFLGLDFRLH